MKFLFTLVTPCSALPFPCVDECIHLCYMSQCTSNKYADEQLHFSLLFFPNSFLLRVWLVKNYVSYAFIFYYPNDTFYMSVWVAKKLHREMSPF